MPRRWDCPGAGVARPGQPFVLVLVLLGLLAWGSLYSSVWDVALAPSRQARQEDLTKDDCPRDPNVNRGSFNLTWRPTDGRFLLALCANGQLSNRVRCFSQHMVVAALLKRTLVVPMDDIRPAWLGEWMEKNTTAEAYNYRLVFNVSHARGCLGANTVWTLEEYLQRRNLSKITIDRVACGYDDCRGLPPTVKAFLFPPPLQWIRWSEKDAPQPRTMDVALARKLGGMFCRDEVVCLPDLSVGRLGLAQDLKAYHNRLGSSWGWATSCSLLLRPPAIMEKTAEAFINFYLGPRFAAAHVRRGDIMGIPCFQQGKCNLVAMPQVAEQLRLKLGAAGIGVLFVATDGDEEERRLLVSLLQNPQRGSDPVTAVLLPPLEGKVWAKGLNEAAKASPSLTPAMLQKTICSKATIFYYTRHSTFSYHINNLREGYNAPTCKDSELF